MKSLLEASRAALEFLQTVYEKEMERTGDYSILPFPEMVDLEDAIENEGIDPHMRTEKVRTEFGFPRTSCDCEPCKKNCHFMPGFLIPSDLDRMIPKHVDPLKWSEYNLLASPGALVSKDGLLFRIPTLVPSVREDGACIHLAPDGLCMIHDIAPFGCSFFDCKPERGNLSHEGILAVHLTFRDKTSLYYQIWLHLLKTGHTQKPAEELRAKMRQA